MRVSLERISKRFGRVSALDAVTLEVPEGAVVAILGVNGAGKSTLLRAMAGVSALDEGRVCYDGEAFHRERLDLRKRLLFTPEMPFFFARKTVLRNIATFLHVYERDTAGREEEIAQLMEEMDIADLALRDAGALSRGQAWKMGVACAAAVQPELWLVDEPFASGMDLMGLAAFRKVARRMAKAGGTVLYTTQLASLAMEFSDWILLLDKGKVNRWESMAALRGQLEAGGGDMLELFRNLREPAA